jgi:hypothetical protein
MPTETDFFLTKYLDSVLAWDLKSHKMDPQSIVTKYLPVCPSQWSPAWGAP